MGRVRVFPFDNAPTASFFRWLRDSGRYDPRALIGEAVEGDVDYQFDGYVSVGVRDTLTRRLVDILEDALRPTGVDLDHSVGHPVPSVPDPEGWLVRCLLADAAAQIDCQCVARALLVDGLKRTPDMDVPEAI